MKKSIVNDMIERYRMKKSSLWFILALILLGCIPLVSLAGQGLPLTHDGKDHVARIANFYFNLQDGNVVPRWGPLLNWGYGHPVLMFLYPLPSYLASLFHLIGFSFIDSVKLVFGIAFVLSGLSMYLFVQSFGNKYAAFVAGMLYMFAPYRFVDLYVRGAIGEHVAFVFAPLVFYFLYRLQTEKSSYSVALGSMSLAGLILSHNAISLMFMPFIGLFVLYLLWRSKKKVHLFIQSVLLVGIGFGLSAFFWLPALLEGKYTLRDIVTENEYSKRFETLGRFIYSPWSFGGTGFLSVQVGIVQWILVLLLPILFVTRAKGKKLVRISIAALFVVFWLTLFIMTEISKPLYETVTLLQKFQFPWRFLTIVVFVTSLMGAVVVYLSPERYRVWVVIGLSGALLLANSGFWRVNGYFPHSETYYTSVYDGTTDTGESSPLWSVRFMEQRPKDTIEVIKGDAEVRKIRRTSTEHEYEIITQETARILENTLYFPGWNIYLNGKQHPVEFQDPAYRGLMTFEVPAGSHHVLVEFTDTRLRTIANWISITALLGMVVYLVLYNRLHLWKRFQ